MARQLKRAVVVAGEIHPAGTKETAALKKAISNPKAWEGEPDAEPAPRKSASPKKRAAAKADDAPSSETPEEPPRGGEGATDDAWRAYAESVGVEVPDDAGRDDIIAAVDARDPQ